MRNHLMRPLQDITLGGHFGIFYQASSLREILQDLHLTLPAQANHLGLLSWASHFGWPIWLMLRQWKQTSSRYIIKLLSTIFPMIVWFIRASYVAYLLRQTSYIYACSMHKYFGLVYADTIVILSIYGCQILYFMKCSYWVLDSNLCCGFLSSYACLGYYCSLLLCEKQLPGTRNIAAIPWLGMLWLSACCSFALDKEALKLAELVWA